MYNTDANIFIIKNDVEQLTSQNHPENASNQQACTQVLYKPPVDHAWLYCITVPLTATRQLQFHKQHS